MHVHHTRGPEHHVRSWGRHARCASWLASVLTVGASRLSPGGRGVKIGRVRCRARRRWRGVGSVVGLRVLEDGGWVGAVLLLLLLWRWGGCFGLFGHRCVRRGGVPGEMRAWRGKLGRPESAGGGEPAVLGDAGDMV
jgi:hypothetical protein